jgi:hypothetical protein
VATDSGYAKRDFLRVCDICGHRFHFSQLKPIGELKFACPDDAPGLTALQISRFNARARPLVVKPNKHAKGVTQTPIYQLAEAQIFNFVAEVAPAGEREGSNDALAAAWAAIYMADIILQEKRPAIWEATARDVLARCLAYLLTLQRTDSTRSYGGGLTTDDVTTDTTLTVAAGIAFVKGYSVTSSPAYLGAADLVAEYVRKVQCGDLKTVQPILYPGTSGVYRPGGLASSVVIDDDAVLSNEYKLGNVVALQFLTLLEVIRGDTEYPTTTTGYNAPIAATLSEMIDELTAFAVDGVRVTGEVDLVSGLSTTEPRVLYLADQGGGSATWQTDDDGYPIREFALALAGLNAAETGTTAVTAMMEWMAAFIPNANYETPDGTSDEAVVAGLTGTFDPAVCPPTIVDSDSPNFTNASSLYDWGSLGLLAPILAEATPPTLRASKDALSMPQRYTLRDITKKYIGPDGLSGLSLQPISLTNTSSNDRYDSSVVRAARAGLVYRQAPGHYPLLRGN